MKWLSNRFLLLSYFALVAILATVGCTSKENPSEVLPLCGNHSCGTLRMVTTDTASDGFHYLNPQMSPDGSRILFTADWKALPSVDRYSEDDFFTLFRQMIVMPVPNPYLEDPAGDLEDQDALLVRLNSFQTSVWIAGNSQNLSQALDERKGDPIWWDNENIIFWMRTSRGNRLFTTDISGICPASECNAPGQVLYMEPEDATISGRQLQHMEPALSPDGQWLAFTRSACLVPDSLETCTGLQLMVMRMSTVMANNGYDAEVHALTNEYMRLEKPSWSPDGSKIAFGGSLDMDGEDGFGTEIYTIDVDYAGLDAADVTLDHNLTRLTYTEYTDGDPIVGVFNTSPAFTPEMDEIIFVSTRRAPSITLHDRNIWRIPADGSLDPEILFFTRSDDMDPEVQPDGSILLSSMVGFPTEMLDELEQTAYEDSLYSAGQYGNTVPEVDLRVYAAGIREQLEFFEGVMAHLYLFRP
jgi:Tol biopolymer transport system component